MKRPEDYVEGPEFERFKYPFTDLPALESHVHPHWVILNTGMKLVGRSADEMSAFRQLVADAYNLPLGEATDFVQRIIDLYSTWLNTTVPPEFIPQEVAQTVPPPTSSVKPSTGNRIVRHTKAALSFVKRRTSTSSFVSSIRSPARKSKRSKVGSINNDSLQEA